MASSSARFTSGSYPTQHAMLVIWGYFAQTLGLVDYLAQVPVPQKTIRHGPSAKLLTFFLGLLSGIEYLSDLSRGQAPLARDPLLPAAWGVPALAEASGVSRTLAACTPCSLHILQQVLDTLAHPFWAAAVCDLRTRQQPLLLDADLTGRPVSDSSQTYPGAAFGYMDGTVHLGYQVAEICLATSLFGRQWLAGQQHPGDTVSAPCLLDLLQAAEARLGCHPRRRVELLDVRIAEVTQRLTAWEQQQHTCRADQTALQRTKLQVQDALRSAQRQITRLTDYPASAEQHGPYGALTRAEHHLRGCQRRWQRVLMQQTQLVERERRCGAEIAALQALLQPLQARREQLAQENAAQVSAPRCCVRLDAGFSSGENLTALLELGYDVETKLNNPAVVAALRQRAAVEERAWTRVGKNAEMIGWCHYHIHTCPYPVRVALERFHTPQGLKYGVLLRNEDEALGAEPEVASWFAAYNGRQTIEAGIKQEKTVFKLQRPMSHSAIGMQIQVALTLFAANFVQWSTPWVQERLTAGSAGAVTALLRPKYLVRIAANSAATVDITGIQTVLRFSELSGLAGVVVHLSGATPVQMALPLYEPTHF